MPKHVMRLSKSGGGSGARDTELDRLWRLIVPTCDVRDAGVAALRLDAYSVTITDGVVEVIEMKAVPTVVIIERGGNGQEGKK
jgi:hypothetical protein